MLKKIFKKLIKHERYNWYQLRKVFRFMQMIVGRSDFSRTVNGRNDTKKLVEKKL